MTTSQRRTARDSMKACPLFSCLSDSTLSDLLNTVAMARLDVGEVLFEQDSTANHIFLLETGYLKLARTSREGNEKIVEFILPGGSFAEAIMFSELPVYPVTATALDSSQVLCIESVGYANFLKESTEACFAVMAELSRRLHHQLAEIDNLSLHSATERLVAYLLHEASETNDSAHIVTLKITKTVLASRLSIKPETLSRTFAKLSKAGFISIDDKQIRLIDVASLKKLQFLQ